MVHQDKLVRSVPACVPPGDAQNSGGGTPSKRDGGGPLLQHTAPAKGETRPKPRPWTLDLEAKKYTSLTQIAEGINVLLKKGKPYVKSLYNFVFQS